MIDARRLTVLHLTALLLSIAPAATASATGTDWPQWRGPDRDGHAVGSALPATLPDELRRLWRVEVGTGHSSPLVVGDRVYVHARQGENEVVRALELADGTVLWEYAIETPYTRNPAAFSHGKGPKSTPVVAGDTLCTLGITGTLTCFDRHEGKVRWQRDFRDRFERSWPDFGTAMSPAIFDGHLIVHVGDEERGALLAFHPETGRELWSQDAEPPAYASPILVGDAVVTQSRSHVLAVDLHSGELLWKSQLITDYAQNSVTAVVHDGRIIVSGLDRDVFALAAERDPRGHWLVTKPWRNTDLPMYMSSPVLRDSLLFGLSHKRKGQLFCLDATTGETKWTTEGRDGENASLILAGDRLLMVNTDSELVVAPASGEGFLPEARYTVADTPVWAHPALVGDRILIKDEEHLTAWSFD